MTLLNIQDLTLNLNGNTILRGLDLEVWKGYVHAIVGPNGAGKSTLSFTIMGLEGYRHAKGRLLFEGQDLLPMSLDERARLGITLGWQEPARYEGLAMKDFIAAGAADKSPAYVKEMLTKVGLDPARYYDRAVDKTLSGGERKKVELASILAMRPRLVMLDEPDSGIDVESLHRIADAIALLKDAGSTVLLITHSMEVLSWAEHAFLMCSGKIVEKGTVDKIKGFFGRRCVPCGHPNLPSEFAAQ